VSAMMHGNVLHLHLLHGNFTENMFKQLKARGVCASMSVDLPKMRKKVA